MWQTDGQSDGHLFHKYKNGFAPLLIINLIAILPNKRIYTRDGLVKKNSLTLKKWSHDDIDYFLLETVTKSYYSILHKYYYIFRNYLKATFFRIRKSIVNCFHRMHVLFVCMHSSPHQQPRTALKSTTYLHTQLTRTLTPLINILSFSKSSHTVYFRSI